MANEPLPGTPAAPNFPKGRVKTPSIQQMEAVECGAASLAMVLAYHGRWIPLEQLRIDVGVSRDGSNALKILQAARQHGLETKGFRLDPNQLGQLSMPAILHWDLNHFVVLEGYQKGTWYINNPAGGQRETYSSEEFSEHFTGIVLQFIPSATFEKTGSPPNPWNSLRPRLKRTAPGLIFAAIAGILLAIPGILIPGVSKIFIDEILLTGQKSWLPPLLLALGGFVALQVLLSWLKQYVLMRLQLRLSLKSTSAFFGHLLRLPIPFYQQRSAGDLDNRIESNDSVASLIANQLANPLISVFTLLLYGVVMYLFDPVLTGVALIAAVVNILTMRFSQQVQIDQNRKMVVEQSKQVGALVGGLQRIETLKATGRENDFFSKWAGYQATTANLTQRIGIISLVLQLIPSLATKTVTLAIIGIGGYRVISGHISLGTLLAMQMLIGSFLAPITSLLGTWSSMLAGMANMNRLDDVLHYPADPVASGPTSPVAAPSSPPPLLTGHVLFEDISFGYDRHQEPLIRDFQLSLTPGKRVAIVGATGSGKSTLARLLVGLNEPWTGRITFDGIPRNEHSRTLFTDSVAMVDQDISLFEGTIRDNIALWDQTLPEEMILRAARDAQIHETIAERPGGYSASLSEGGTNLSGGQRQRLEIARALVREPRILILDEATSALDPQTEMKIDGAIRRRGCTCLIIAHRLSTIRDADEILVLDQGQVAERGTHSELISRKGTYAELVSST
ncbi:MAG: NHLP family bacteriocin export ABC transporter peptidase/permease/ATPase subunit [Planctomycetota bacterium]|jgi:NHLM bacteriocin system ABC transporter peptidase/ATP-binding protein|nr:NHLP family bacteriocin export ABC transporter peptidase/permease/ATPase subunit [Planctomycetota bacterium]